MFISNSVLPRLRDHHGREDRKILRARKCFWNKLTMLMTACTRHMKDQARKNSNMERRGEHEVPPPFGELFITDSCRRRKSQFRAACIALTEFKIKA